MTHKIIKQADHPNNRDPIAKLIRPNMPVGQEIYSCRGGYLACLEYPLCLDGLFPTVAEAQEAQARAIAEPRGYQWDNPS